MNYWLAELIVLVGWVLLFCLNSLVGLRSSVFLGFVCLLFLLNGLLSRISLVGLRLSCLLWLLDDSLLVLWLCLFHVYYFTCWIVEFWLFTILLIILLRLGLLSAILLISCLRGWSWWHHFCLYWFFWLLLSGFILVTLIWWPRKFLLWCVTPGNSTISIWLFLFLCNF